MTDVFSKGYFNDQLDREITRSTRYKTPLSAILFDIDHFKQINDTVGHFAGDEVLVDLSRLIKANIRKSDCFARSGGEEFVILAPGISLDDAGRFAETLRRLVEGNRFKNQKSSPAVLV